MNEIIGLWLTAWIIETFLVWLFVHNATKGDNNE